MKQFLLLSLDFYKQVSGFFWGIPILFVIPVQCKFYPTCSVYTKEAIFKYGFKKGLLLGIFRILKCNPLFQGGADEP